MNKSHQPPHSAEAEKAILGAILRFPEALDQIADTLTPEDFYIPAHQIIYAAAVNLSNTLQPIDPVTVSDALQRTGDLTRIGGALFLSKLTDAVPSAAAIEHYAETVAEHAARRGLIRAAHDITEQASATDTPISAVIDTAERNILAVADRRLRDGLEPVGAQLGPALKHLEELETGTAAAGLPTGLTDLDKMLAGLRPGNLVIIAGRTSTGKSALATDIATHTALHHGPVALFSLEMSRLEVAQRILTARGKINSLKLKTGQIGEQWSALTRTAADLHDLPLYVDEAANASITEIRAQTRRLQRRKGLQLAIVDYLQLMRGRHRPETRQTEIAEISRSLKSIAQELSIPIIALSQLNRLPETRTDKRPHLSDLRESGAIEQDADIVILIHRDQPPKGNSPQHAITQLIVAKHRNGPTGTVKVAFQEAYTTFANLAHTPQPPP